MNTKLTCRFLSLALALASSGVTWSQTSGSTQKTTNAAPRRIVYRAAPGAAAATRLTGGSRGSGDMAVRLDVLSPDEVGLTTQEQPSLFWYQSKPAKASFELTLLEDDKVKPLLDVKFDRASQAGIQRIKLADHRVKLRTGVEYRWVVALVLDPANRSKDLIASGFIKRVDPSPELQSKLAHAATPAEKSQVYAAEGIWHDALSVLSDQIAAHPANAELRADRADLLRQVGLSFAAAADEPAKSKG
jgi:hypothetical protein